MLKSLLNKLKTVNMKKLICILITGIMICPLNKIMAQSRKVYWIHGLSGNANSLKPHDDYFKNLYQMNSKCTYVSTANGIQGAAQELSTQVNSDTQNRNILVAHSMGGVNSLWLHKIKGSSYVGGLVSMGSPYKGAYIADNIDNGVMDQIVSEGFDKGSKGVRSEPLVAASWMTNTLMLKAINALFGTEVVPTTFYGLLEGTAKAIFKCVAYDITQSSITRNSLKIGSSDIKAIQQYTAFTNPTISFYGVEDYPATLRFVSSRLNVDIVGLVGAIYATCGAFSSMHSDQAILSLLTGQLWLYSLHNKLSSDWAVSRDYWNTGLPSATDLLTGCYRTNTVTETHEEWIPDAICDDGIPYHNPNKGEVSPICTSGHWETVTSTHTEYINTPGDGLVPVTSPQAMPACLKTVKMEHTNHEEMKTSEDVRYNYLQKIFDGSITTPRNSAFFIVPKR
jgi:hypothetical protein